jgi:hypothetical protein
MKKNKTAILAVSAVAVAAILYFVLKSKRGVNILQGGNNNTSGGGGSNSGGGSSNSGGGGSSTTVVPLDFSKIADSIFIALDGYGTKEEAVYFELAKLRNESEWESLKSAYGVRTLSSGRFNVFNKNFTGTLTASLLEELNENEINRVNSILSKIGVSI